MYHSDPPSRTDLLLALENAVSRQLPGVNFFRVYSIKTHRVQGHASPWQPSSSNGARKVYKGLTISASHGMWMANTWSRTPGWVSQDYIRPILPFDFFLFPILLLPPSFQRYWSQYISMSYFRAPMYSTSQCSILHISIFLNTDGDSIYYVT